MVRVAVFIHGMWATADVWRNWRALLEARGWRTIAPTLRHHEAPPAAPSPALGTTSLLDSAADRTTELGRLPEKPGVIGDSLGGLLALMLCGRGLARAVVLLTAAAPAGVVALRSSHLRAFRDRLTPPGVVRRTAQRFRHVGDYVEELDKGHRVLGPPGWQRIAEDTAARLEAKVA